MIEFKSDLLILLDNSLQLLIQLQQELGKQVFSRQEIIEEKEFINYVDYHQEWLERWINDINYMIDAKNTSNVSHSLMKLYLGYYKLQSQISEIKEMIQRMKSALPELL